MLRRAVLGVALVLASCGGPTPSGGDTGTDAVVACIGDDACSDGHFCNGLERCDPMSSHADARGCTPARAVPCLADQVCDESMDRCMTDCAVNADADGDGVRAQACGGTDCDDGDAMRAPGRTEVCDPSHDEDCDLTTYGSRDRDHDGFVDASCANGEGTSRMHGPDCDDLRASTSPTGAEVCNLLDDDCDGAVDEGASLSGFVDADGDLHGDPTMPRMACPGTGRFAVAGDDCDDTTPAVHAAQVEICDGLDNDCDTRIDEHTVPVAWYPDADGDGYGVATAASSIRVQCEPLAGYAVVSTDCDDMHADVRPGAIEACNGRDDDCNGAADFVIGPNDSEDDDHDGHVDHACGAIGDDCDDADANIYAGAAELCDQRDDDCDAIVDEMPVHASWYLDRDGDGAGEIGGDTVSACEPQPGRVLVAGDCDDARADWHPGAPDGCDGHDEDCDALVDEDQALAYFVDADGDGVGTGTVVLACTMPAGDVTLPGDCDDTDPTRAPGARELCDGRDQDCDTTIDEDAAASCGAGPTATCVSGACVFTACVDPYLDCDTLAATGCEADPRVDPLHCGGCTACPDRPASRPACVASTCDVACDAGFGNCDGDAMNGCEVTLEADPLHCGDCMRRCAPRANADAVCASATCALRCHAGYTDCDGNPLNGCETWIAGDTANCGTCRHACATYDVCGQGDCFAPPFDVSLATDVISASGVLSAGAHYYRSITVPAGATVRTDGTGVLELYATGDIVIDGTIDLSGGDGGRALGLGSCSPFAFGYGGSGGNTGTTIAGAIGVMGECASGGGGGIGALGSDGVGAVCATGGARGGGAGGVANSGPQPGGGGGGYAGGAGGSGDSMAGGTGGDGASVAGLGVGGMGTTNSAGHLAEGGDRLLLAPYGGLDGPIVALSGGGGSIGFAAAADLDVSDTFSPGSGGGGGGGSGGCSAGAGGGGGGGALRIVSLTRIIVRGVVRADGGGSDSTGGPGGGGGSGGVVYLSAPEITVTGHVSAIGGRATGVNSRGGDGGLGRIRLSTIPERCDLVSSTFTPALVSGCAPTPAAGTAGRTYIGVWPL